MAMAAVHLTQENFETEVMQSDKPVMIDFWASWCGPCQTVAPVIEELAQELTDVKIAKVNVDEQPDLATKFRIMSIPTMVLLKNGKVIDTTVGAQSKEDLIRFIQA
jgi:thioredoxin 1